MNLIDALDRLNKLDSKRDQLRHKVVKQLVEMNKASACSDFYLEKALEEYVELEVEMNSTMAEYKEKMDSLKAEYKEKMDSLKDKRDVNEELIIMFLKSIISGEGA